MATHRGLSRREFLALAAGTAALGVATACAPGASTASPTPAGSSAPKRGGELKVTTGLGIAFLDPQQQTSTLEKNFSYNYAETLVFRDRDSALKPSLASSWDVSADGTKWTFKLRGGVKFHDGSPLDASTVKLNVERWIDPKSVSAQRFTFQRMIASARVVDDATVEITTKGAQSALLAQISGFGAALVSSRQIQADPGATSKTINARPIGTGPYRVESFVPNESFVLVRNPDYWGDAPWLDKIQTTRVQEPSARTAALLTGQSDLSISVESSQIQALQSGGAKVEQFPTAFQSWMVINLKRPPLDNRDVRLALNHAIDQQALKQLVGGLAAPFNGPVNPIIYKPATVAGLPFDADRARALLSGAGHSALTLKYTYDASSADTDRIAQALQEQLRRVGITLTLDRVDFATTVARRASGDFELCDNGFGNASGDPVPTLLATLHSLGTANYGKYVNEAIDKQINDASAELNAQKRNAALDEIWRLYLSNPAWANMTGGVAAYALGKRVQNLYVTPVQDLYLSKMWLSE
jgi:peptide/nickel transport system substrate-binding protein